MPNRRQVIHSSPLGHNGRHIADDSFICIFMNESFVFWLKVHWSLFLSVQLNHWRTYAALGGDELTGPVSTKFYDAIYRTQTTMDWLMVMFLQTIIFCKDHYANVQKSAVEHYYRSFIWWLGDQCIRSFLWTFLFLARRTNINNQTIKYKTLICHYKTSAI